MASLEFILTIRRKVNFLSSATYRLFGHNYTSHKILKLNATFWKLLVMMNGLK